MMKVRWWVVALFMVASYVFGYVLNLYR